MKKAFKILGIILLGLITCITGFIGYRYYKIKTFKDSYDLQEQVALKCNKFIRNKKAVGLAVGIIQGSKVYAIGFGYPSLNSTEPVDTNTIFEIGSITKVFTAELGQILSEKGILTWNETMYSILPPEQRPAADDGTTMLSLATHTSGFPKTPKVLLDGLKNRCNPYKDMDSSTYASCIKNGAEKKKPDANNSIYSNMGFSILANCLEAKAGCSYDSLLKREIFNVLGMSHTTLHDTDTLHFASGYNKTQNETCHWDFPAFYAGCGAIRSNMSDMVKFLQANMKENPLFKPFSETQKQVYKSSSISGIGKAWQIRTAIMPGTDNIIWHNGGTGGFRSYIGIIPEKNVGIVVLSNQASDDLDGLGFDLLTLTSRVSLK